MDCTARIFVMGLLLATPAFAAVSEVNLANYQHTGTFALPPVEASEASAVVYNPDTDTLFVLGD
ncbi:MAG: PEP-CTERM sorting domain-containing protein, partial [Phycisphaerales bacterium]|nr:PEP-CTERM sorting domain-containing protein [Phycisphaerales bacterium]